MMTGDATKAMKKTTTMSDFEAGKVTRFPLWSQYKHSQAEISKILQEHKPTVLAPGIGEW